MSDLLTPAESHEFHSFLSSIDYGSSNDTRSLPSTEWASYTNEGINIPALPQGKGREALAKATKDLMSLDSSSWGPSSSTPTGMNNYQHSNGSFNLDTGSSQYDYEASQNALYHHHQHEAHHHQSQNSTSNVAFTSHTKHSPLPPPLLGHTHSDPTHLISPGHVQAIAPMHTMGGASPPISLSYSTSNNGVNGPSSPPAPSPSTSDSIRGATSSENGNVNNKRPLETQSYTATNKRARQSHSNDIVTKSTLLSPSQKKANHIQSEQKRRANIRRGYEALCETVPALRDAIRQEEEAHQVNGVNGTKGPAKPKRTRGKGKVDEGTGEKIDGRAGPRSENIVLGKTIDYINDLLKDREALLARLDRAKSSLGPNHPSCASTDSAMPLWERQWNGGSGKDADAEEEEEEEEEE
ncbi:hypothetical protein AAF712_005053 [Marasmius tenuissimus]|uniref:BHLH domain-containing protein n=1 Tax=Marasmius tenuissimus TaxID=585030 RepID=A0ABR3A2X5_9AGAR